MTQPNLLELAKQGDPQAIATLMNRSLQPKGIVAKVVRQGDRLQVMLESAQIPNQAALTTFVRSGIQNLGVQSLQSLQIWGRQTGSQFPTWRQEFELDSAVPAVPNPSQSGPAPSPRPTSPPPPPPRPTAPLPAVPRAEASAVNAQSLEPDSGPITKPQAEPKGGEPATGPVVPAEILSSTPSKRFQAEETFPIIPEEQLEANILSSESVGALEPTRSNSESLDDSFPQDNNPQHNNPQNDNDGNIEVDIESLLRSPLDPPHREAVLDPEGTSPNSIPLPLSEPTDSGPPEDHDLWDTLENGEPWDIEVGAEPKNEFDESSTWNQPEASLLMPPGREPDFEEQPIGNGSISTPIDDPIDDPIDNSLDFEGEPLRPEPEPIVATPTRRPARFGTPSILLAIVLILVGGWILALIGYSLWTSLNTPTPTPTPVPETVPPSPEPIETVPEAEASPDNVLEDAASRADAAIALSQTAQSADDWNLVVSQWQQAIALLNQIPAGSPGYASAQELLPEYQTQLATAQQQAATQATVTEAPPVSTITVSDQISCSPVARTADSPAIELTNLQFGAADAGSALVGCITNHSDQPISNVSVTYVGTSPTDPDQFEGGFDSLEFEAVRPGQTIPFVGDFSIGSEVNQVAIEALYWTPPGANEPQRLETSLTVTR